MKKIISFIKINFEYFLKKEIVEEKLLKLSKKKEKRLLIKKKKLFNENKSCQNIFINKKKEKSILKKKNEFCFKINSVKSRKNKPFRSLLKFRIIILIVFSVSLNFWKLIKTIFSGDFKYFDEKIDKIEFINTKKRFFIKNFSQEIFLEKKKNYILKLRAIKKSKQKIQKKIIKIENIISKKRKFSNLPIILETPLRV